MPAPMPPHPGGLFSSPFVISAFVNALISSYNAKKSRDQQERIQAENRKLSQLQEQNRQQFQLEINARNAQAQRELSVQNHQLRLQELNNNFANTCRQAEYQRFLSTWPLLNMPEVIRQEQVLSDETVALRVIFSKSNDAIFGQAVFPLIEQGLREFVELYHNVFKSRNLIFYHNGFTGTLSGGAMETNIHYALKELPVIIIDTTVLPGEINVSFTMWGFGAQDPEHATMFKIPYQPKVEGKTIPLDYYIGLSNKILAYLKYILGFSYDAYNLIQYNRAPLLPQVAAYELEKHRISKDVRGPMLLDADVKKALSGRYGEIYDSVIGTAENTVAAMPASFKQTILHELRLEYAESLQGTVSAEQYQQYLDESLDAWVNLRSTLSVPDFLNEILSDALPVAKYFSNKDKAYFEKLKELYTETESGYSNAVEQVCSKLENIVLPDAPKMAAPLVPAAPEKKDDSSTIILM